MPNSLQWKRKRKGRHSLFTKYTEVVLSPFWPNIILKGGGGKEAKKKNGGHVSRKVLFCIKEEGDVKKKSLTINLFGEKKKGKKDLAKKRQITSTLGPPSGSDRSLLDERRGEQKRPSVRGKVSPIKRKGRKG